MPPAMSDDDRSFTLEGSVPSHKTSGRYVGAKPSIAGQHAAREVFKANPGVSQVVVRIRESTRGSNGKIFAYRVSRMERSADEKSPRQFRKPNGQVVDIHPRFVYKVVALKEDERK